MIRYALSSVLIFGVVSASLPASEPQQCGGISDVACRGNLFCDYPVGTCGVADVQGKCKEIPQICPTDWQPVVGCDGRLYSNACMAAGAGVSVKHPFSEPRLDPEPAPITEEDAAETPGAATFKMLFSGKVRAEGSIERRAGRWSVESFSHDWSDRSVSLRIRFSRSVRNAVIVATPYCSFSDHGAAPAAYGYFDDRTVDFVYVSPCGFIEPSGLDFLVVR